jgi:hypothetical protein
MQARLPATHGPARIGVVPRTLAPRSHAIQRFATAPQADALRAGRGITADALIGLQQTAGNRATQRVVGGLQTRAVQRECGCGCGGTCSGEREQHSSSRRDDAQAFLAEAESEITPKRLVAERFAGNERLQRAFHNDPPLRLGEQSNGVAGLQQALTDLGYDMPRSTASGEPDGIYGSETARIVREFQEEFGVRHPSGHEAGHKTLASLDVLFEHENETEAVTKPADTLALRDRSKAKDAPPAAASGGPGAASLVVPADPSKPKDLGNFKCRTRHTLRIEVFFVAGASGTRADTELRAARDELAKHNVGLDFSTVKRCFTSGGDIQTEIDWCQFVKRQLALLGHDKSKLPVFFVPAKFMRGNTSAAADGGLTIASLRSNCQELREDVDLDKVVVIDCCGPCDPPVLLHELGHAVKNVHEAGTFMHPSCNNSTSTFILPKQLEKFCRADF